MQYSKYAPADVTPILRCFWGSLGSLVPGAVRGKGREGEPMVNTVSSNALV